jgi:hypothetical protein
MPYFKDEGGRLNNFAIEPKMYKAEAPDNKQKQNYLILSIATAVLVGIMIFVAVSISG